MCREAGASKGTVWNPSIPSNLQKSPWQEQQCLSTSRFQGAEGPGSQSAQRDAGTGRMEQQEAARRERGGWRCRPHLPPPPSASPSKNYLEKSGIDSRPSLLLGKEWNWPYLCLNGQDNSADTWPVCTALDLDLTRFDLQPLKADSWDNPPPTPQVLLPKTYTDTKCCCGWRKERREGSRVR